MSPPDDKCPFCALSVDDVEWSTDLVFALRDRYPVSRGHTLLLPRRHVATWFEASAEEKAALVDGIERVKQQLDETNQPDGYNVGFNAGVAAGQTVPHLHVHVIPRYRGDMDDPRGGVRHVIPSRGNYLRSVAPLATGGDDDPFARHLEPLFARADDVAIVAAFVQQSGLKRLHAPLVGALGRGARVRLVTGDYLHITQAAALEDLCDLMLLYRPDEEQRADSDDDDELEGEGGEGRESGSLEVRVVETDRLPTRSRSFHPKAWRFEGEGIGTAFVGSSNISRSALTSGIEWNLRLDRDRDHHAWERLSSSFEALWQRARPLDESWVAAYAARAATTSNLLPSGEVSLDPVRGAPEPHPVQQECLEALRSARESGRTRALVVMATGLGKTWTAAFDVLDVASTLGRRPRVLFLAHRREILQQAANALRDALRPHYPGLRVGHLWGEHDVMDADVVLASVQKLARPRWLEVLSQQRFDYAIIDEVHHAAADSYRRVLDHLDARFLLGLTATPDRADAANVLSLFDDFEAYRADLGRGIAIGRLVPFSYFGVKDEIDYAHIPWRNKRFDPEVLSRAAETEARMQQLWRAWQEHPGTRTLVFCCSQSHARYVRKWLREKGVRVDAVFSGEDSDDRDTSLQALERGELDAICAVDVLNEGVDIPSVDRVVMLRPTESAVVYLQQLGRGLRVADGKERLTIVDFVGNHRVFLERTRQLLSLAGKSDDGRLPLRALLDDEGPLSLPDGCSVELELEAKDLLRKLMRRVEPGARVDAVEQVFDDIVATRGRRPTAGELFRQGYLPSTLRKRSGPQSWFDFVASKRAPDGSSLLDEPEQQVVAQHRELLRELEQTSMNKCFKMVALEAWLELSSELGPVPLEALARRSHTILRRSPELADELPDRYSSPLDDDALQSEWLSYWNENPIRAWDGRRRKSRAWFRAEDDRFGPAFEIAPEHRAAFADLVRELIDYRLAQYRRRSIRQKNNATAFTCKVMRNQRNPILMLPGRGTVPGLPEGETEVWLEDGSLWTFKFVKIACNVARPVGERGNHLPDLLRRWFGPRAGEPSTGFEVELRLTDNGWTARPIGAKVLELRPRRSITGYPDLRAAAGAASAEAYFAPEAEAVALPLDDAGVEPAPDLFAVRVSGTSMQGGSRPLHDGDWAILRFARGQPLDAVLNRVALVETLENGEAGRYLLKRVRRRGRGFELSSDNPEAASFEATADTIPIALLVTSFRPEDLGPKPGTRLRNDEIAAAFGLERAPTKTGRMEGHLFVIVDPDAVVAQNRVKAPVVRRPGETAFVLVRVGEGELLYCGVGRWVEGESAWGIPALDASMWRGLRSEKQPV